ncbi:MAG: lamin tail domain-containing protein [Flavobacteriales bacterium]|nr:lamin tail domain-containing protein [Flavobacteriales bacterium]
MKLTLPSILLLFVLCFNLSSQDLVITEIMYNPPESGSDTLEFIEIKNMGSSTVFVGGYQFTQGVTGAFPNLNIPSGSFIVFSSDSLRMAQVFGLSGTYTWTSGGLSNSGEDIVFTDANGVTVDSVDYEDGSPWPTGSNPGPNGGGVSIVFCGGLNDDNNLGANWFASTDTVSGLIVNGFQMVCSPGSDDAVCSSVCIPVVVNINDTILLGDSVLLEGMYQNRDGVYYDTLTASNNCDSIIITNLHVDIPASTLEGDLVITEIMYNPPESGTDSLEFVEIYNNSSNAISLDGFYFWDGINYTFPSGASISASSFVVLAGDSTAFHNAFGFAPFDIFLGGLSNSGEELYFIDDQNMGVDLITYDDGGSWPGAPTSGGGSSMVLCDFNSDNNIGGNWTASNDSIPGLVVNGQQVYASPGADDAACTITSSSEILNSWVKYVNPVNDDLNIMWFEKSFESLTLFDVSGKMVLSEPVNGKSAIQLSVSHLDAGIYVALLQGERTETIKLVKY